MTIYRVPMRYADWGLDEARTLLSHTLKHPSGNAFSNALAIRLATELNAYSAFTLNSGRVAIRLALQALAKLRPSSTEVIVPAYLCPSAIKAICEAGCTPIAVEIGDDLNIDCRAVLERLDSNVRAVLVAHMYGCPADVATLEQTCRTAGIFLIDDAAQVYGVQCNGRSLGSFGDLGILSFAQSKTIVTGVRGSGGALLVNNPELHDVLDPLLRSLPPAQHRRREIMHFTLSYLIPGWSGWANQLWDRLSHGIAPTLTSHYNSCAISEIDAALALNQLDSVKARVARRTAVADLYACLLRNCEDMHLPQHAPGRYLSRVFVLLPDGITTERIACEMRARGVQTRRGYPLPKWPTKTPIADTLAPRLLELPSWADMPRRSVEHVCDSLMASLDKYSAGEHPSFRQIP